MSDEDVAPSRAELDAMLWVFKRNGVTGQQLIDDISAYLKDRGVSQVGIGNTLKDMHTYSNYPVGDVSA